MTSRNATHRTLRSPSLFHGGPVTCFFFFFVLFFFTHYPQTFPPSAKSALLALVAQNVSLISKTLDHRNPHLFLYRVQLTKKEKKWDSREHKFSCFLVQGFQVIKSLYDTLYMDGTNANFHENLLTSDAELLTLHGTQKTAVLNTNHFLY